MARHAPASRSIPAKKKDEKEWSLFEKLQRSEWWFTHPTHNWPDKATSTSILNDYWLFASCPDTLPISIDELKTLARIHADAEPLLADFFMRAMSISLPDSLHARPQLLPAREARRIMARLSPTETARIHRAFYRWQLLNCVAMFPRARQLTLLALNAFKAWCLCMTWKPWEVCEVETLHAYFRHQYELILDAVNADFIHRLEAMATPDCPDTDDWWHPEPVVPGYPDCVGVTADDEPRATLYVERQVHRGIDSLRRLLTRDDMGRRRSVRRAYHVMDGPMGLPGFYPYIGLVDGAKRMSLFACGRDMDELLWTDYGSEFQRPKSAAELHQPNPGWYGYMPWNQVGPAYEHSLLTGLVFWDSNRIVDSARRVQGSVGVAAAAWLGFRLPWTGPGLEGAWLAWRFTPLPSPLPFVDQPKVEELQAEFGTLPDDPTED
jgi:hypothetical protein